jgi:V-ATPase subunit C
VYSGWIHLKVIYGFVESVLRYGLPSDFLPVFIQPNIKKEKQLNTLLFKVLTDICSENEEVEEEEGEDADAVENLPYVCHKFNAWALK